MLELIAQNRVPASSGWAFLPLQLSTKDGLIDERWLSPRFLAGESYGAFRAAGLAHTLHKDFGFYLNGVILVSGILSFDTMGGTDLSYVTFLEAMSEVAAYHKKLDQELQEEPEARREEVEAFARGNYATALLQGRRISEADLGRGVTNNG